MEDSSAVTGSPKKRKNAKKDSHSVPTSTPSNQCECDADAGPDSPKCDFCVAGVQPEGQHSTNVPQPEGKRSTNVLQSESSGNKRLIALGVLAVVAVVAVVCYSSFGGATNQSNLSATRFESSHSDEYFAEEINNTDALRGYPPVVKGELARALVGMQRARDRSFAASIHIIGDDSDAMQAAVDLLKTVTNPNGTVVLPKETMEAERKLQVELASNRAKHDNSLIVFNNTQRSHNNHLLIKNWLDDNPRLQGVEKANPSNLCFAFLNHMNGSSSAADWAPVTDSTEWWAMCKEDDVSRSIQLKKAVSRVAENLDLWPERVNKVMRFQVAFIKAHKCVQKVE